MLDEPPLDAPDEEWLVWADAMQQAGDPRGELIALANHPEQFAKHVERHAQHLLGSVMARHLRKGNIRIAWRRARPDIVELRLDRKAKMPQLVSELIASPIAPQMRGVSLAAETSSELELDLTEAFHWLHKIGFPRNWTSLSIVDARARAVDHMLTRDFNPEPNLVNFGPLRNLWRKHPHLEELRLVVADPAQLQLGTIELAELRAFTLHCLYWTDGTGRLLAGAKWPKLTSLELRLVEDFTSNEPDDKRAYRTVYNYPDDGTRSNPFQSSARDYVDRIEDLEPLFGTLERLPLERLAITGFNDGDLVLGLLEAHPLPSLVHLDLSDSNLTAADLERLANNPLLLQLKTLVLERITAPTIKALASLDLEIRHSCEPAAPGYRYVVGWE